MLSTHQSKQMFFPRVPNACNKGRWLLLLLVQRESRDTFASIPGSKITQIPNRVCLAIPTDNAQSQPDSSLSTLYVNIACFTHGQHYVAMSGSTPPSNFYMFQNGRTELQQSLIKSRLYQHYKDGADYFKLLRRLFAESLFQSSLS